MTTSPPTARELLDRLVSFDTTSSKSNLALVEDACDLLESLGARIQLTKDESGAKANAWATLGPGDAPGYVLSGHTDVVPVEGQPWTTDPFTLTEKDGRLHGRGTSDMKGFIAVVLAELARTDPAQLARPVHVALSYDEEVGCHGAKRMLGALPQDAARPELVVIGEPTGMNVVQAHKGLRAFEVLIEGRAAHSAVPERGLSAVHVAMRLVAFLEERARELKGRPDERFGFEPPHATVSVGQVHGGTAINIVPRECRVVWEQRPLPGADPDEVLRAASRFLEETFPPGDDGLPRVTTRELANVPALAPLEGSRALVLAGEILGTPERRAASYTTEAGLFQRAGIPAVVCGPGHVEQAHQPDEHLAIEQLERGAEFVRGVLRRAAAER